MFISVDLPAPFSPSSAWTSPLAELEVDGVVRDDARERLGDAAHLEDGVGAGHWEAILNGPEDEGRATGPPLAIAAVTVLERGRDLQLAADDLRLVEVHELLSEAGTAGFIVPTPMPPFFRLNTRSVPPRTGWP